MFLVQCFLFNLSIALSKDIGSAPSSTSVSASSIAWSILFIFAKRSYNSALITTNQFIFVQVFEAIGEKLQIGWLQGWLTNQKTGFIGLLIVVTWQLSGYMMMIYIAQIQNIPDSVLEAAQIDGAIGWNKLKSIILPLMMPAFTIGLFLSISNAFKLFDQNISLTGGGPVNSTQMLALNIYNTAFGENRFGLAQSKAVIFMIVVMVISIIQLTITKKKEVEA